MEEEEEEEEEEEGEESLHNTWDEIMSIASAASDRSVYGDDDDDRSTTSSTSNERYQFVEPLEAAGYDNHIAPDNARSPQEHDDAEEPVLWVRRNDVYEVANADEAADAVAGRDGAPSAAATLEEDAGDAGAQYQTGLGPLLRSQSGDDEDTANDGVIDNDVLPPGHRFTVQSETTRRRNRFRLDGREITMAIRRPLQDPDTNTVSWLQGAVRDLHAYLTSSCTARDYIGLTIKSDSFACGAAWLSYRPARDFLDNDV
ncbi:uncharacterized protein LOC107268092 [Cephus cinctus]|uniref:Uncharacterized protein LOC107268092 n=1 Tax=Cephus cinctus TaxID=211228 RepID=A0AAJ7FKA5_CEPCN|nr:uncharacterized protein LOC107268092 [Cephus cinctus]